MVQCFNDKQKRLSSCSFLPAPTVPPSTKTQEMKAQHKLLPLNLSRSLARPLDLSLKKPRH